MGLHRLGKLYTDKLHVTEVITQTLSCIIKTHRCIAVYKVL